MGILNPRFRIVRGHVRDQVFGRSGRLVTVVVREGWWWACIGPLPDGSPYSPEGAFGTKESARRHLWAIHTNRAARIANIRWTNGRFIPRSRVTMRPIPCNRPTPAQIRRELGNFMQ